MANYNSFSPNDITVQPSEVYKYVQGDTGPQLRLTFTDEDTGTATDLTSATVTMHFRSKDGGPVLFSKTLYVNPDPAESIKGIAIVNWAAGDLDQDPGDYLGEIEVIRSSGVRETLYDALHFTIREDFA